METTLILIRQILQMFVLSGRGYLLSQWKKSPGFFSAPLPGRRRFFAAGKAGKRPEGKPASGAE